MTAMQRAMVLAPLFAITAVACAAEEPAGPDSASGHFHGEVDSEDPYYDELADSLGTVAEQKSRCTTRGTLPLSLQIIDEMNCMSPGSLTVVFEADDIRFVGSAVLPVFSAEAIEDIYTAANLSDIEITSGFRSVVQQHLIWQWYEDDECDIPAAAEPGRSRHESGKAVDIVTNPEVARAMNGSGFHQPVEGDDIHFEHLETESLAGLDVLAFQRLWNRNNPDDLIYEHGEYDELTATKIDESPSVGFFTGATCARVDPDLDMLAEKVLSDLPKSLELDW